VIADYFTSPNNADEKDDDDNCMPSSAHSLEGTAMYEKTVEVAHGNNKNTATTYKHNTHYYFQYLLK